VDNTAAVVGDVVVTDGSRGACVAREKLEETDSNQKQTGDDRGAQTSPVCFVTGTVPSRGRDGSGHWCNPSVVWQVQLDALACRPSVQMDAQ
jgi:hypothetical protein